MTASSTTVIVQYSTADDAFGHHRGRRAMTNVLADNPPTDERRPDAEVTLGLPHAPLEHLALCGPRWSAPLQTLLAAPDPIDPALVDELQQLADDAEVATPSPQRSITLVLAHLHLFRQRLKSGQDPADWMPHAEAAMRHLPQNAPLKLKMRCCLAHSAALIDSEQTEQALHTLHRALALSQYGGHVGGEIEALNNLSVLLVHQEAYEQALTVLSEGLRLFNDNRHQIRPALLIPLLDNLGYVLMRRAAPMLRALLADPLCGSARHKDLTLALRRARQGMRLSMRSGRFAEASCSMAGVITMLLWRGNLPAARMHLAMLESIEPPQTGGFATHCAHAYLCLFEGRLEEARDHVDVLTARMSELDILGQRTVCELQLRVLSSRQQWREAYEALATMERQHRMRRQRRVEAQAAFLAHRADQRARRMRDLLLHDLGWPLRSAASGASPHAVAALAERALTDIELSLGLLRGSEETARPQAEFDLGLSVEAAVEKMQPQAARGGVVLALETPLPWAPMTGHADTIESALAGLVAQAVAVTPPQGTVRVGLQGGHERWIVSVTDGGVVPDLDTFEAISMTVDTLAPALGGASAGEMPRHLVRRAISLDFARQTAAAHHGLLRVTARPPLGLCAELVLPRALFTPA
jgi:hypothetical protein